jgi:hypothetical protein
MHADQPDRMHDLKIVRIVGDQAVPDVLCRGLVALIGHDFPAIGGSGQRAIVLGQRQQLRQIRCDFRGGGLAGADGVCWQALPIGRKSLQGRRVKRLHRLSSSGSTSSE